MATKPRSDVISSSELKARCAEVIARVETEHRSVVVTRRGKPVARIEPIAPAEDVILFGYAKGQLVVTGDLLAPIDVEWEAAR